MPSESSYSGTRITLHSDASVTASPTLTRTYTPADAIYNPQTTYLQFSADGRTGWRNLAKAAGTYGAVSVKGWATADDGWYRLYHPTRTSWPPRQPPRCGCIAPTSGCSESTPGPEPIRKGATLTVSGTLQQYVMAGTRSPIGGSASTSPRGPPAPTAW